MFVINANANGSASATAYATGSGGGTSQTSASGYYEIPMNGSTYNMFYSRGSAEPTPGGSGCYDCLNVSNLTFSAWNGNNPNASSVVGCGKARDFDQDVLFPNNYSCDGCPAFGRTVHYTDCISLGEHNLDEIVEMDLGTIPPVIFETIVSRKEFCGGEKIGRRINACFSYGNIACMSDYCCDKTCCYESQCGGFFAKIPYASRLNVNCPTGSTAYVKKCPRTIYMKLGIMHDDGTKDVIAGKDITSSYYNCLYIDDGVLKGERVGNEECYGKINFGKQEYTPIIACKGDRTYIEYGICEECLLYDVYTKTKCDESCNQNYGTIKTRKFHGNCSPTNSSDRVHFAGSTPFMGSSSGMYCSACNYSCCDTTRFKGIQFSIE